VKNSNQISHLPGEIAGVAVFYDYRTDITIEIKTATTKSLMPMFPFLSEKMLEAITEAY
jgi:hypothetical protein|tara:strand:+ start:13231 stop:13407 length:177 start_codon:yes stop_codon:yes gene_type:complete